MESKSINIAILDCGCPSNVVGEPWLNLYKHTRPNEQFSESTNNEKFKFGPSNIFTSNVKVKIPITLGTLETYIEASVVKCNIPLLISRDQLEKWESKQDYKNDRLEIGTTGEILNLERLDTGHHGLQLGKSDCDAELEKCFYGLNNKGETYLGVKKVHRYLGHPSKEKLISLYRNKGSVNI